jgi:CBS domain-containing protein
MTDSILVGDAMSREVLTVGPGHSLREVAQVLAKARVGSAIVHDTDSAGIGIITERDILRAVANGDDLDGATASDHQTTEVVFATTSWSLIEASDAMRRGGFRHLVVLDGGEVVGIISVRDIIKAWAPAHT